MTEFSDYRSIDIFIGVDSSKLGKRTQGRGGIPQCRPGAAGGHHRPDAGAVPECGPARATPDLCAGDKRCGR